jgi:hypothetical protein
VDPAYFSIIGEPDTLGETSVLNDGIRDYFQIVYADSPVDHISIWHEMGHTLGLDHPYGDGYNSFFDRGDTIMSYNRNPAGTVNYQESDIAALKYLWGEAGTGYDYVVPTQPTAPSLDGGVVSALVSRAWRQPYQVSSDNVVTYYIDTKGKVSHSKRFTKKGVVATVSRKERSFIREVFVQIDNVIGVTVSEVASPFAADIVIGCMSSHPSIIASTYLFQGRVDAMWTDLADDRIVTREKGRIAYAIASSFGLSSTSKGYSTSQSVMGWKDNGYYGLTVNDVAALQQLWNQ